MSETETPTLSLAPSSVSVAGPTRGRYDLMDSRAEQDRYIVRVDGITISTTFDLDRSDEIAWMDWPDKIKAIAEDTKRWISSPESMARAKAVYEWINRDDPEDERLVAIERAQIESEAQELARTIRNRWPSIQKRVLEILQAAS